MIKLLDLKSITELHSKEYKDAINRIVDSGWFLLGNETRQFESDYANYIGTSECVAVANGLDALYLILRAYKELGIMHDGDEIIVPANTYIATILSITRNQLIPVLVEPTFDNLELDIERIEGAISPRTRGIMTVHLYGRIAFDDRIRTICDKYGLKLMEDCAQSQGCSYNGRRAGSLGDAAAHSFYPGKNLGAFGDAGAVTTSDKSLSEVVRALANYGSHAKYIFKYAGINSRMSEMDAAILSIKLKYLDEDNRKRQILAGFYYENINNPLITLPCRIPDENNVYHQFPIFCTRRDELQKHLLENGVQTLIHYPIPPHMQECYQGEYWNNSSLSLPITEKIHHEELSIPMNQVLSQEDATIIVNAVNSFH